MATPKVDLAAPEFSPKHENPRIHVVPIPRHKVGIVPTEPVKVVCIVECRPWAYVYEKNDLDEEIRRLRPLAKKEIVMVDSDVADVLVANEHAVRV